MTRLASLVCIIGILTASFFPLHSARAQSASYGVTVRHDRLTMSDGVDLAVTYFMPAMQTGEKYPVLFEMNPYRKDDMSYLYDYPIGSYFARRGYVVARVDVRGTGSSKGVVPPSEYSERELADGVEIVGQLATKPWSNGNVGMYGLSWSAFNSLMIAARKPPALKAILIAHASDDLFYQDVHSIDGAFHVDTWEAMIDTFNALPSPETGYAFTPEFFANRFDQKPWHFVWKRNQADGPFYRRESVRFKSEVMVPVYIIGGLLDGYRDTIARLMDSSNKNIKADLGPWNHDWPNNGEPGPNYEWKRKAVQWFDHWLKGLNNGIMGKPRFMVFMRDGHSPSMEIKKLPGEWRCGDWPIKGIETKRYYPSANNGLAQSTGSAGSHVLKYRAGAGLGVHTWWGELSEDMADDDEYSLVYDSPPLTRPVEIIGFPRVRLNVSADTPLFHFTARLEDVGPDGQVSLVSGVLINPADRTSRLSRSPLAAGKPAILTGEVHYTTWRFKPGHKIRLAISNAQFPMAWPTPHKGSTRLFTGPNTWLELPIVAQNALTARCEVPPVETEEESPGSRRLSVKEKDSDYPQEHDGTTGDSVYTTGEKESWTIRNVTYHRNERNTWRVNDKDPARASYKAETVYDILLPGRKIRLTADFGLKSDERTFYLTVTRKLYENGTIVRERSWTDSIPRNYQ
jgi:predicted acyl esterase